MAAPPIIRCPGCSTEIDPGATMCHICGRPRSRREMLLALQGNKAKPADLRKRAYVLLALIVAGLTLPALYKKLQQQMADVQASTQPKPPVAAPAQAAPPKPAAAPAAPAAPATAPGMGRQAETQTPGEAPQTPTPQAKPASDVPDGQWRFFGQVYDLFSLKPVARVALTFRYGADRYAVTTNAKGRFSILVPQHEQGYGLVVRHGRYKEDYLDDSDPPLAGRSEAAREQAAYEAAQSAVLHVPYQADPESRQGRLDLVLVPKE